MKVIMNHLGPKKEDPKSKLVREVFCKINEESTGDAKTTLSKLLSDKIEEQLNERISFKTLTRYYDKYIAKKSRGVIDEPLEYNLDLLSRFIGYKDFSDFRKKHRYQNQQRLHVIMAVPMITLLTVISLYYYQTETYANAEFLKKYPKKWMYWSNDHYEEFLGENTVDGKPPILLEYNEQAVKDHRKIDLSCGDAFKDTSGNITVWYHEHNDSKIELFNFSGLHPEKGVTLNQLNPSTYRKYICKTDEEYASD